jgi:hypothetical protein
MIATLRLLRRALETERAYTLARLALIKALPGNPFGIAWHQLDAEAIAARARNLSAPWANCVLGLRAGLEPELAPLIAWYGEAGRTGHFVTDPGYWDPALGAELMRLGCYQSDFEAWFAASPHLPIAGAAPEAVERIDGAHELPALLKAGGARAGLVGSAEAGLLGASDGRLSFYRRTSRPHAVSSLFIHDRVAHLTLAEGEALDATVVRHLLAEAGTAGVEFVVTAAQLLSERQAELGRLGMRLAFVRAFWRQA